MSKSLGKIIIQYSQDSIKINQFISISEASRTTNIGKKNIQHSLSGRSKTAGGYIWKYAD